MPSSLMLVPNAWDGIVNKIHARKIIEDYINILQIVKDNVSGLWMTTSIAKIAFKQARVADMLLNLSLVKTACGWQQLRRERVASVNKNNLRLRKAYSTYSSSTRQRRERQRKFTCFLFVGRLATSR